MQIAPRKKADAFERRPSLGQPLVLARRPSAPLSRGIFVLLLDPAGCVLQAAKVIPDGLDSEDGQVHEELSALDGLSLDQVLATLAGCSVPTADLFAAAKDRRTASAVLDFEGGPWQVDLAPFSDGASVLILRDRVPEDAMRRRLEELEAVSLELEAVFRCCYDELYITDRKGTTLRVNGACERFYGAPPEKLIGKRVTDLESAGLFTPSVTPRVVAERRPVWVLQKTKTNRTILCTSVPVFDENGEVIRVVSNTRDLSELIDLQRKLEQSRQQTQEAQAELSRLRAERAAQVDFLSRSAPMQKLLELAMRVANSDSTLLINGESGVGKNAFTRFIHHISNRSNGPLIEINCAAIPDQLVESELFGYEAGAFTGAQKRGKSGVVEMANGGTLVLNEVGELPLHMQTKLLEFIQNRRLRRVGGVRDVACDVRIVSTTNRDLRGLVQTGKFREDLYYRLNVIPINIPPLRERPEDIGPLIDHYLRLFNQRQGEVKVLTPPARSRLLSYRWPGNVRELEHVIERLVVTVEGQLITEEDLVGLMADTALAGMAAHDRAPCSLQEVLGDAERALFQRALAMTDNTYEIARLLRVSQPTVVRKLKRYGLKGKGPGRPHTKIQF